GLPARSRQEHAAQGVLQDTSPAAPGGEISRSQRARLATVPVVVAFRGLEGARRVIQRPEPKETVGVGQEAAWAGMLNDRGLPARQVTDGPVADPAGREGDIGG